jgi:hypothetical protein
MLSSNATKKTAAGAAVFFLPHEGISSLAFSCRPRACLLRKSVAVVQAAVGQEYAPGRAVAVYYDPADNNKAVVVPESIFYFDSKTTYGEIIWTWGTCVFPVLITAACAALWSAVHHPDEH